MTSGEKDSLIILIIIYQRRIIWSKLTELEAYEKAQPSLGLFLFIANTFN